MTINIKLHQTNILPNKHKVCSPLLKFCSILSTKLSGSHDSVQYGIDIVSPKLYN